MDGKIYFCSYRRRYCLSWTPKVSNHNTSLFSSTSCKVSFFQQSSSPWKGHLLDFFLHRFCRIFRYSLYRPIPFWFGKINMFLYIFFFFFFLTNGEKIYFRNFSMHFKPSVGKGTTTLCDSLGIKRKSISKIAAFFIDSILKYNILNRI